MQTMCPSTLHHSSGGNKTSVPQILKVRVESIMADSTCVSVTVWYDATSSLPHSRLLLCNICRDQNKTKHIITLNEILQPDWLWFLEEKRSKSLQNPEHLRNICQHFLKMSSVNFLSHFDKKNNNNYKRRISSLAEAITGIQMDLQTLRWVNLKRTAKSPK